MIPRDIVYQSDDVPIAREYLLIEQQTRKKRGSVRPGHAYSYGAKSCRCRAESYLTSLGRIACCTEVQLRMSDYTDSLPSPLKPSILSVAALCLLLPGFPRALQFKCKLCLRFHESDSLNLQLSRYNCYTIVVISGLAWKTRSAQD